MTGTITIEAQSAMRQSDERASYRLGARLPRIARMACMDAAQHTGWKGKGESAMRRPAFAFFCILFAAQAARAGGDECAPTPVADALANARAKGAIILENAAAQAFAESARATGAPMAQAAYVFLYPAQAAPEAEWLDDASQSVALQCGWSAPAVSPFGRLVIAAARR
ncbi:MAG: hypothetical protein KGL46_04565 [Hyphomicrobiales bacterium]|nr:hypothetical protein [Hyphomicrobiales bacterium]